MITELHELTDEQILSCIPLSNAGKPCVWLTQKDAIQAIKSALKMYKDNSTNLKSNENISNSTQ